MGTDAHKKQKFQGGRKNENQQQLNGNEHTSSVRNSDGQVKATEKLSSGFRINRAGDDAIGLAISKMRGKLEDLHKLVETLKTVFL